MPRADSGRDAGVHDVAAVVAGIVPSAVIFVWAALAGGTVEFGGEMASGMRIAVAEVDVAATALTIVAAHREPESVAINIRPDCKGGALAGVGLKNVCAGLAEG